MTSHKMFNSNYSSNKHRFYTFDFEKYWELKSGFKVQSGHSRSSKLVPFDGFLLVS